MATAPNSNINIPYSQFLDATTGRPSLEWLMWLMNPSFISVNIGGALPVTSGGTGLTTIPTNGQLLIGNGTGYSLNTLTPSSGITVTNSAGTITIANSGVLSNVAGSGISVSSATGNVTINNTGVLSWSGGTTGLTPATATTGAVTLAGTLAIANGGTNGSATPTAYGVAYGDGSAYAFTAAGTTGQVLTATTGSAPTWAAPATSGTVTSVSFTGGLITVATPTTTPALTVAGTSGGVVYFSSASTWASSAALAANALVVGGGAGTAPSTVTTGTGVVTALGVNTGTAGAFVVNGGALGTPSSGTVTNLTGTASININGTVGATTANSGAFTSLSYTTTLTGGTGIIAIGTNQFYKDASGNVGMGATPVGKLDVFASSGGGAGTVVPVSITVGDTSAGNLWPGDGTLSTVFNYFSGDGTNNGVRFRHGVGETNAAGSTSVWKIQYRAAGGAINNYTGFSDALIVDGVGSVRIDNYVGIGGAGASSAGLKVTSSALTTNSQVGVQSLPVGTSAATVQVQAFGAQPGTAAAAFTCTATYGLRVSDAVLGAGSTITSQYGVYVDDQTRGTNNYGFRSLVSSGANKYNIYASGTAANWFSGDVLVFGAGGLGYTTGSGGTVTQGTSRTTGVTLNKTNGAITMFSAAGSVVAATFTVTNSTVAATDTIILNQKSGTNLYILLVTAVAAGSFNITFYTTGGVATDAPVINFSVIKAVTA